MEQERAPLTVDDIPPAGQPGGGQTVAEALAAMDWMQLSNELLNTTYPLCLVPTVSASHNGETFSVAYSLAPSKFDINALLWLATPEFPQPTSATLNYSSSSYDSAEDALHLSSVNSTLTCSLNGSITAGTSSLSVVLHAVLFINADMHIAGESAPSQSANIVDVTWNVTYGVERTGVQEFAAAIAEKSAQDNSQQLEQNILSLVNLSEADVESLCLQARNSAETLATGLGPALGLALSI